MLRVGIVNTKNTSRNNINWLDNTGNNDYSSNMWLSVDNNLTKQPRDVLRKIVDAKGRPVRYAVDNTEYAIVIEYNGNAYFCYKSKLYDQENKRITVSQIPCLDSYDVRGIECNKYKIGCNRRRCKECLECINMISAQHISLILKDPDMSKEYAICFCGTNKNDIVYDIEIREPH